MRRLRAIALLILLFGAWAWIELSKVPPKRTITAADGSAVHIIDGDSLRIDGREDGRGNPYYWIGFQAFEKVDPPGEDTDLFALDAGYVTVTPLRLDRTDVSFAEELKKVF